MNAMTDAFARLSNHVGIDRSREIINTIKPVIEKKQHTIFMHGTWFDSCSNYDCNAEINEKNPGKEISWVTNLSSSLSGGGTGRLKNMKM